MIYYKLAWFVFLLSLSSCIPREQRKNISSLPSLEQSQENQSKERSTQENQPPFFWLIDRKEEGFAHLYRENFSSFFLGGAVVESYLSDPSLFSRPYCLVIQFATPKGSKELRMKAIPYLRSSFSGERELLFLMNANLRSENSTLCGQTLQGTTSQEAFYHPDDLCQNQSCGASDLSSTSIKLWTTGHPSQVVERINLGENQGLLLHLGSSSLDTHASTPHAPSCTDSSCGASGTDCCSSEENEGEFNTPDNTPTSSSPTFQELLDSYYCQEGDTSRCHPDRQTVIGRIQVSCDCPAPNTCPHLRYQAERDVHNNIINISCLDTTSPPPQAKDIVVYLDNSSVPHRFFRKDTGKPIDNLPQFLRENPTENQRKITQEGQPFFYLDDPDRFFPQSGEYNMNAIMGQLTLDLNGAKPAAMVSVEFGQVYIISGLEGSYIPCPLCPRDRWFEEFSAYPTIAGPNGLIATGYGTRRDFWGQNRNLGNYEDTKFGRACWVPPTMIPFSHKASPNLQTQRLNRLSTQSALYINGYQRDWFGFNKGALIGSFDGARWFAIGSARRIQAKSHKLFLAINAPFGDLAGNQRIKVTVVEDKNSGGIEVPNYDFDPSLPNSIHAHYNRAASCQQYHMCEVDSDCVTQLGWEYQCADISSWKTSSPRFDASAEEKTNHALLLSSRVFPVGGAAPGGESQTKRCVYRGRGALCQQDFSTLQDNIKKLFTCAPNFYCASLDQARSFNHQLVRTPQSIDNILYGFEANVLGRPLHYLGGRSSLPDAVKENIRENVANLIQEHPTEPGSPGSIGICLPGKDIDQDTFLNQHQGGDTAANPRTDYINQIGSCDSSVENELPDPRSERVLGCPIFNEKGDYLFTTDNPSLTDNRHKFLAQNSCGHSSQDSSGTRNTFENIETTVLGALSSLARGTHSEHACLRRASSPCFTDLDCSPSRLHSQWAAFLDLSSFGGTQGEKNYWQEYLVCGQSKRAPLIGSPEQIQEDEEDKYLLTENRCCRPLGESISFMGARKLLISEQATPQEDLSRPDPNQFPVRDRSASRRYSRYMAIYEDLIPPARTTLPYLEFDECGGTCPKTEYKDITRDYQWKAPHDLANKTCCGGAWVRKFSDGTHDWTKTDRLFISPENFKCLNYRNEYIFNPPSEVSKEGYNQDLETICLEAKNQGCSQINWESSNGFTINTTPRANGALEVKADFSSLSASGIDLQKLVTDENFAGFAPTGLRHIPRGGSGSDPPWVDYNKQTVTYYLPSYINVIDNNSKNNLVAIGVSYHPRVSDDDFEHFIEIERIWDRSKGMGPSNTGEKPIPGKTTKFKVQVNYDSDGKHSIEITCVDCDHQDFKRAFPTITFIPMGTQGYYEDGRPTTTPLSCTGDDRSCGMKPGSDLYYLTKLGRLELLGIPSIHYEPLYCNTNMNKLVPGLYRRLQTREHIENKDLRDDYFSILDEDIHFSSTDISQSGDSWVAGDDNKDRFVLTQKEMNFRPIFHETEVVCCAPLGSPVDHSGRCCTNHARENPSSGKQTCALPSKTNLMVYFNRFVSGEGRYHEENEPSGLTDNDFNPKTGEPKLQESTYDKIAELGNKYCDNQEANKTRTGAAVGAYFVEPRGAVLEPNNYAVRRYGIVDSLYDSSVHQDNNQRKGYWNFVDGFRWNHHLYCK